MALHPKAKEIASYVLYERDMLIATAAGMNREGALGGAMNNALLESFLIHSRVLRDFFFSEPRGDDVSAKHFFDEDHEWQVDIEELCPHLDSNSARLDKSVAHLSYRRLQYSPRSQRIIALRECWEYGLISKELGDVWELFINSLPHERYRWFPNPKERAYGGCSTK